MPATCSRSSQRNFGADYHPPGGARACQEQGQAPWEGKGRLSRWVDDLVLHHLVPPRPELSWGNSRTRPSDTYGDLTRLGLHGHCEELRAQRSAEPEI
jgi:hypothetical protein